MSSRRQPLTTDSYHNHLMMMTTEDWTSGTSDVDGHALDDAADVMMIGVCVRAAGAVFVLAAGVMSMRAYRHDMQNILPFQPQEFAGVREPALMQDGGWVTLMLTRDKRMSWPTYPLQVTSSSDVGPYMGWTTTPKGWLDAVLAAQ